MAEYYYKSTTLKPFFTAKRKRQIILAAVLVVLIGTAGYIKGWPYLRAYLENKKKEDILREVPVTAPPTEEMPAETAPPPSFRLEVPWTVQAPLGNWNVHENSCEEAVLLMAHYYFKKETFGGSYNIPKEQADRELTALVTYQKEKWGGERDLTMEETGKLGKEYYGIAYKTVPNATSDDIKKEITRGNVVVMPAITHSLIVNGRPTYGRTPVYHTLILKGYKSDGVIANDPGVAEGRDWFYSWDTIFKAMDAQAVNTPKRTLLVMGDPTKL